MNSEKPQRRDASAGTRPRRLVAAIACRNQGTRLYGKPLQNLDVERGVRILDHILDNLSLLSCIDAVVLGIAEGDDNLAFVHLAERRGLRYVIGDEQDVLSRLIACGQIGEATDLFRITSESPFLYYEAVESHWKLHLAQGNDATFMDQIIDGCGFEIFSLSAAETAHRESTKPEHREHCTLFLRENDDRFRILRATPPQQLSRFDLRLTVDYPEDLVVCRAVYAAFRESAPQIPVMDIVDFLDSRPELVALIQPYVESGYQTMFR